MYFCVFSSMSFCSVLFCSALLFPVSLFPTSLCEVLVFGSVSCPPPLLFFPPVLRHTNFHTTFSYTRTHFCHTHNFVTHNFVTLHLSHTTLSHTSLSHTTLSHSIFHTQLCHTHFCHTHNLVTHIFVTHSFHTHTHNFVTHTHTPSFTLNFVIHIFVSHNFVTHHLSHSTLSHTFLSHTHTHATLSHTHNFITHTHAMVHTQLCHTHLCHTQLGHTHLCHTQLCHTPSLRGWRGGPWRHRLCICVAGVALGDIHLRLRFVWQAWHLATHPRHFVLHACATYGMLARCRAVASQAWHLATSTLHLRGKPVAWRDPPMFAWQAWRLWRWAASAGALQVARAPRHLAWQARHLATSTCTFRGRFGPWRILAASTYVLRGRRGTYGTGLGLVVRLGPVGRRGAAALCVASVALGDIHLHFAWHVWHLATFAYVLCGRRGAYGTRRSTLRGRRGTWRHRPWFGVAGLATSTCTLRGKRGTWRHPPMFCVAGVTAYGYQGRLSYRRVVVV